MKSVRGKKSTLVVLVLLLLSLAVTSEAAARHPNISPLSTSVLPARRGRVVTTPAARSFNFGRTKKKPAPTASTSWSLVPRGGDTTTDDATKTAMDTKSSTTNNNVVVDALTNLKSYIQGPKSDALILLTTTALIYPLCNSLQTSPILGLLTTGLVFGPNGANLIQDVHGTELLADLGVVFFLFEMGIHLSFKTLMEMKYDVFGLGLSQFVITAIAVGIIASSLCGLSTAAGVVLGGGLALSSSAFVLQLLKDKDEMETKFGRSAFGVLLLQDLMVVPLLVIMPLLAGGDEKLGTALTSAGIRIVMALSIIATMGKLLLNPLFDMVASSNSQEAFVSLILGTVLGMSFLTEGLGLSNTLGAFLAGMLLSESKHRHTIETEFNVFRAILVGIFFFTVGFEIDLNLITSKFGLVSGIVIGIIVLKATITSTLCLAMGKGQSLAQRAGLILGQGGEFGFVAFRMARSLGILDEETTRLMLTCVSLTMALTPFLDEIGVIVAKKLDEREGKGAKDTNTKKVR